MRPRFSRTSSRRYIGFTGSLLWGASLVACVSTGDVTPDEVPKQEEQAANEPPKAPIEPIRKENPDRKITDIPNAHDPSVEIDPARKNTATNNERSFFERIFDQKMPKVKKEKLAYSR